MIVNKRLEIFDFLASTVTNATNLNINGQYLNTNSKGSQLKSVSHGGLSFSTKITEHKKGPAEGLLHRMRPKIWFQGESDL
jgi:hypothetical protein